MINQPPRLKKYIYDQLNAEFDLLDHFDFIDNDHDPILFYNWVKKWKDFEFKPFQRLLVIDTDSDYYSEDQFSTYGNNCFNFFNSCQYFNIPTEFIIFISGSFNKHKEIYKLCDLFNLANPTVIECTYIADNTPIHKPINDIEFNLDKIDKLFSCLNGTKRAYRLLFLCYLKEYNLLDLGYVTYHFKQSIKDHGGQKLLPKLGMAECDIHLRCTWPHSRTYEFYKLSKEEINLFEKHSNFFDNKNFNYPELELQNIWNLQMDFLQKSLINVVTESAYHYPHQHSSEKFLKPITTKRPFIVVGPAGLLKELRGFGFKTFDQFWDESYDEIIDPSQRMAAIVNTINSLKSTNVKTLAKKIQPLVEFNFHLYKNKFAETGLARRL